MNIFSHVGHLNFLSLARLCVAMWSLRFPAWKKAFSHMLQTCCLEPNWILLCNLRVVFLLKPFWHLSHWYGFSDVCADLWFFKTCNLLNDLLHTKQQYGFLSSWTPLLWLVNSFWRLKSFWHRTQESGFTAECTIDVTQDCFYLETFSHKSSRIICFHQQLFSLPFLVYVCSWWELQINPSEQ